MGMKSVLIVDDDEDIRQIITWILSEEGYEVSELPDGSRVVDTVAQDPPDLLLLDVMLGDTDGRDICKTLKNDPATQSVPVIIISATHGWDTRHEKDCGADYYIAKPFDIQKLVEQVRRFAA
jgi:DNA-binding response OmpR family regulator